MTWTVFRCQPEPSFSIRIYLQLVLEIISFVLHMNCFDIVDDCFIYNVSVRWYPFYYQTNSLSSGQMVNFRLSLSVLFYILGSRSLYCIPFVGFWF